MNRRAPITGITGQDGSFRTEHLRYLGYEVVACIKLGLATELHLGTLDAKRDWGHAADYVRAMHQMLAQDEPDDYVVASGESHSVREFCASRTTMWWRRARVIQCENSASWVSLKPGSTIATMSASMRG